MTKFTRYIGTLNCNSSTGDLLFTVYSVEPANTSIHENIGLKGWQYRFDECVVLDDNILSRLEMTIDWSKVRK